MKVSLLFEHKGKIAKLPLSYKELSIIENTLHHNTHFVTGEEYHKMSKQDKKKVKEANNKYFGLWWKFMIAIQDYYHRGKVFEYDTEKQKFIKCKKPSFLDKKPKWK